MALVPPPLQNVENLVLMARRHSFALPAETRQSLPIPVRDNRGLRIAFLFCPERAVIGKGIWLRPPAYRAFVNCQSGKFEELAAVVPGDFGQKHPPDEFLTVFKSLEGVTWKEYVTLQKRLYELYDLLLPPFAARRTAGIKTIGVEFRELFARISETPLQPYYQAVGQEFFAWLEQVVR